jgi:molybdopterin converting factor small subunit
MIFGRKRADGPPVRVEARILGTIGPRYLSVQEQAELPPGSTVRDLLESLRENGKLDEEAYGWVASLRPPLTLLINGTNAARRGRDKTTLADGDVVTILTPITGG